MKLKLSCLTAALIAMSPIAWAQSPPQAPDEMAHPILLKDYRVRAQALMLVQSYREAHDLLLANLSANRDDVETNFLLAQALLGMQKIEEAIGRLREILNRNPELQRVRLELARAYSLNHQKDFARQEFNIVLASNPPQVVGDNIQRFLAAMDAQKDWNARIALGYLFDSNVNAGPSASSVLMFGVPFTLNSDATPRRDEATILTVAAGHVRPLSHQFAWQSDFAFNHTGYNSYSNFDSDIITVSTGPSWRLKDVALSLPLVIDHTEIGHERYNDVYGISPQVQYAISGNKALSGSLTFQGKHYQTAGDRDGTAWSANGSYRVGLDTGFIQAGIRYGEESTRKDYFDYSSSTVNFGAFIVLPGSISLFAQPMVTWNRYRGIEAAYDRARDDVQYAMNLNLSKPIGNTGLVFAAGYTFTRNDSNLPIYDYRREQASLQVSRQF